LLQRYISNGFTSGVDEVSAVGRIVRGGIEAGGTKFVCAVGTGPDDVHDLRVVNTTTPAETLGKVADFFADQRRGGLEVQSLGIASFGPLEGLASGPAIRARFGRPPEDLGSRHDLTVDLEAWYLAQLVTTVVYLVTPQSIVLGGGVLHIEGLLDAVRSSTLVRLAAALDGTAVADSVAGYLVRPALGGSSGVLGALALAQLAGAADGEANGWPAVWPATPAMNGAAGSDTPRLAT
jgi:predicted NBD/HSP70 family sugar kinase